MLFLRRFVILILLLAWVPASSHCLLATALQNTYSIDCCIDSDKSHTSDSHNNSDCCPFCDTFESGKFLTSSKEKLNTVADVVGAFSPVNSLVRIARRSPSLSFIPHESPSSAASWQFEIRSARLGRSPNLLF